MGELIAVGLLVGGGFVVAVILLVVASFGKRSRVTRGVLCGLAFVALALQGGCWMIATSIGRATGGGGGDGLVVIVMLALIVAVVWACAVMSKGGKES